MSVARRPKRALAEAVSEAMVWCPLTGEAPTYGPPAITAEECAVMVRAAIAIYLFELAKEVGSAAGLSFSDDDDE